MADSNVASQQTLKTNEPVITHWAHTYQSKLHKINFRWSIHNFTFLNQENGKSLTSPTFSSNSNDEIKWALEVFPNGTIENKDWLSIFIKTLSEPADKSKILGKCKFAILNNELNKEKLLSFDPHEFKISENWGFKNFIKRAILLDKTNNLLPGDSLTIDCEVSFVSNTNNIFLSQESIGQFKIPECELVDDFGNLLDDPKFSDVTLMVGEHAFLAHKAILAARSTVFAAMFKHEMKENMLNRVIIIDVEHEVLEEMLRFIYTGEAPKLKVMANQLLVSADKYALKKLKAMAEEALFAEISIETAAETLVLADFHSADQLKEQTISFITIFAKDIIKTKGWQRIVDANAHSNLIAETLKALLRK